MKLMELHSELDRSLQSLSEVIEHRKLRLKEEQLLDFIARIDILKTDITLANKEVEEFAKKV